MPLKERSHELFALFVMNGPTTAFDIVMPQAVGSFRARKAGTGVATANGAVNSTQVTVTNPGGIIPIGTLVQFAGHSKVYMTKNTLTGSGTLQIYPGLRAPVVGANLRYQDDVVAPMLRRPESLNGALWENGLLMDNGSITFIERL